MSAHREAKYHCSPCLNGEHRRCSVMLPLEWDGTTSSSRCVCKRCTRHVELTPRGTVDVGHDVARPRRAGAGRPVSVWTPVRVRELIDLTAQGLTSREVAERVGTRPDTVRYYLMKARRGEVAVA